MLLDTNIIIDYLSATRQKRYDAADVLQGICETTTHEPVISISSPKDVYYMLCRAYGNEEIIRERRRGFIGVAEPIDLTRKLA